MGKGNGNGERKNTRQESIKMTCRDGDRDRGRDRDRDRDRITNKMIITAERDCDLCFLMSGSPRDGKQPEKRELGRGGGAQRIEKRSRGRKRSTDVHIVLQRHTPYRRDKGGEKKPWERVEEEEREKKRAGVHKQSNMA